jgi:hypothetical protein
MAEFRMVKTKVWRDKKFRRWDAHTKLLSMYFMTNEYVPPSGIFEINLDVAKIDVGFNGDSFTNAFNRLVAEGWLKYNESFELIWIINYLKHFPSKNQSVMVNIYESVAELPECDIKSEFRERYNKILTDSEQAVSTLSREEKSRVKKSKGEIKTPSPTQEIFDHWDTCYRTSTGEKYPFFGERDGRIFKSLAVKYGKDKVNSLVSEFFKQADEDPDCWWHDKLDVAVWFRQIPKLITQLTRGK